MNIGVPHSFETMRRAAAERPPDSLAELLRAQPGLVQRGRMSCAGRQLRSIGSLPQWLCDARPRSALLSNNSLATLRGAEAAFAALRDLSVADNALSDLQDLIDTLSRLPELRSLCVKGNPVADLPHFRARIIAALPTLTAVDARVRLTL